jgi:enoyl-[acyl-carrier protein] reductase III
VNVQLTSLPAPAVARTTSVLAPTGGWAVVLGASSGMGLAVTRRLAADGVNVLGVHFDTAARAGEVAGLEEELSRDGVTVRLVNANAASAVTRQDVVLKLLELGAGGPDGGGVGILLHSLAFGTLLPFVPPLTPATAEDGDQSGDPAVVLAPKQMTMTLEVMAHSLVWWVRDLLTAGLLGPGSHVLAMTSAGDSRVSSSYGAVSAAKSALLSHVRQLAVELAPHGVSVNALRAGVTLTPSLERIPESGRLVAAARSANPHGRLTTPQDVAEAVATLTRTRSSWLTGNVIGVDGGEGLTT